MLNLFQHPTRQVGRLPDAMHGAYLSEPGFVGLEDGRIFFVYALYNEYANAMAKLHTHARLGVTNGLRNRSVL